MHVVARSGRPAGCSAPSLVGSAPRSFFAWASRRWSIPPRSRPIVVAEAIS